MKLLLFILTILCSYFCHAQLGVNTYTPDDKSIMDIRVWPGKGGGVLMPRLDTDTRRFMLVGGNADVISIGKAQNSMLVYDTTQNQYYYFNPDIPTVGSTVQTLGAGLPDYTAYGATEDAQRGWQVMTPFRTQYTQKSIIDPSGNKTLQTRNLILDTLFATGNIGIGFSSLTEVPLYTVHIKGDGYYETNLKVEKQITTERVIADTLGNTGETLLRGYGACPIGTIMMWSPNTDNKVMTTEIVNQLKAEGWMLCDGSVCDVAGAAWSGKVPDMQGKFVVALDTNAYDRTHDTPYHVTDKTLNYGRPENTGGEDFHALTEGELPDHQHSGKTNKDGKHQHKYYDRSRTGSVSKDSKSDQSSVTRTENGSADRITYDDDLSNHEHLFTTYKDGGGNQTHENRPNYIVMAYIIRVK